GPALPRRRPPREGTVRRAGGRVPGQRGIRDDSGSGRARDDRAGAVDPRNARVDPPRWSGRDPDLLRSRGRETAEMKPFERARQVIPGGVNSPVRAFKAVGGHPVFLARGEGSRVRDTDGSSYVDYVGSWGPLILGHRHPGVVAAIREATETG